MAKVFAWTNTTRIAFHKTYCLICCICNVNFVFPNLLEIVFCIQKNLPFLLFYGAFWSKIGDLNSHPQFGKLMCWPLTLILHIKVGSQALPVPCLTWFFLTRWFHHKLSACFYGGFYASHTRGTTWFSHLYMTKKTSDLPLNAKNAPTFVLKAGAFLRYG